MNKNGFDLYNILRSVRSDGVESIMLGMVSVKITMSLEEGTVCMLAWFQFFRRRNIFRSVCAMSGDVLDHVSLEEQRRKSATLYFL